MKRCYLLLVSVISITAALSVGLDLIDANFGLAASGKDNRTKVETNGTAMTIYYIPFDRDTVSIYPTTIRVGRYRLVTNDKSDIETILHQVSDENIQHVRFEPDSTRLRVEYGSRTILMDTDGNVRSGSNEYEISPEAFLRLNSFLDGMSRNSPTYGQSQPTSIYGKEQRIRR